MAAPEGADAPFVDPADPEVAKEDVITPPAPRRNAASAVASPAIEMLRLHPGRAKLIATYGGPMYFASPAGPVEIPRTDPAARLLPQGATIVKTGGENYDGFLPAGSTRSGTQAVDFKGYDDPHRLLTEMAERVKE
jgi:hypothetical protein